MLTRRLAVVSGLMLAACGGRSSAQVRAQGAGLRMSAPRAAHSMVGLADGSVLLIGGCVADSCETGPASSTVDRFDPATHTISEAGRLLAARTEGAAAALPDGRVLLAGGWSSGARTASVEVFDLSAGRSRSAGSLSAPQCCAAIPLGDGRVLLLGERSIEMFDASKGLALVSAQTPWLDGGTATLLDDGRVLVVGGGVSRPPRAEAFLVSPASGKMEPTGSLSGVRRKHAAVKLLDGRVLIVGGADARDRDGGKKQLMEVYDPRSGRFSPAGNLVDARYKIADAALRLPDGRVLAAGGADRPEVIDPTSWRSRTLDVSLGEPLNFSVAAALSNGDVLVAGGYGERTINPTAKAWIIPKAAMA